MSGLYAADGSINVTVVTGSTFTGLYAADGSWNVIASDSTYGIYHACGALRVTLVTSNQLTDYAANGSLNVSITPYYYASLKITVVSGSFGPPPSGFYYVWLGF